MTFDTCGFHPKVVFAQFSKDLVFDSFDGDGSGEATLGSDFIMVVFDFWKVMFEVFYFF